MYYQTMPINLANVGGHFFPLVRDDQSRRRWSR